MVAKTWHFCLKFFLFFNTCSSMAIYIYILLYIMYLKEGADVFFVWFVFILLQCFFVVRFLFSVFIAIVIACIGCLFAFAAILLCIFCTC